MKTLRTSDDVHQRLTGLLGELTAQTMRMQTYTDAIESLLSQSAALPPELLAQIEDFAVENRRLGYTSREEFVRDAARWRLRARTERLRRKHAQTFSQIATEYTTTEQVKLVL